MTQSDTHLNEQELKRYLYSEMSDEERGATEETLFLNDELFYAAADLENELVDRYARGQLSGAELERFERSLEKSPGRRQKAANAAALKAFIKEEKPDEKVSAAQTFRQKAAKIFRFENPAFGYAAAGLLLLFVIAGALLILDNRRKSAELARLQNERANFDEWRSRERELQNQVEEARRREGELQNQIDTERDASVDLTEELERERAQREKTERELENVRREANISRPTRSPLTPVIASVLLKPLEISRNAPKSADIEEVVLEKNTTRLAVRLLLPEKISKDERVSVRLNGKTIARNLAVRVSQSGEKSVQITVWTKDLPEGENRLYAADANGEDIGGYIFSARRK